MTLTEFLLARIAEEIPVPVPEEDGGGYYEDTYRHPWSCATVGSATYEPCDCDGAARALAECEAKRRIVDLHAGEVCGLCSDDRFDEPQPCPTLRALLLPYADHPDCDEKWKS